MTETELPEPSQPSELSELSEEDAKLVLLANGARARSGAPEGAAVRDDEGRSYSAATVALPSLQLTALQAAVAAAVSAGAAHLEAAVIVASGSGGNADEHSLAAARDLGAPLLLVAALDGTVLTRMRP